MKNNIIDINSKIKEKKTLKIDLSNQQEDQERAKRLARIQDSLNRIQDLMQKLKQ